ncbi:SETMR methyltransferase, partial [Acromyrmex charruanus]
MTVHVKQDFGRGRNFNMEQRTVIKFNAKLGKSASETFRSMQQIYGICLGRTAVFEWHKRFLEGRQTLEDDKKSGRPILVRTPEMIEKVRDFVANDRNASLKMMEEALNISRETIRTILHEDLGKTKVCAKFVPHTLRSDQKSARINYSRDIQSASTQALEAIPQIECGGFPVERLLGGCTCSEALILIENSEEKRGGIASRFCLLSSLKNKGFPLHSPMRFSQN